MDQRPGGNGPTWIVPAHYAKQFHPRYNKNVPKSWASTGGLWQQNVSYKQSTKCPTLTPFKLTKYSEARALTWERNPYAYEVTKDGDQLPYIDGITMTAVVDPQVGKVQITAGKIDYVHGPFNSLILADVSTLMKNKDKAGLDVYLWDSGSGTASIFFLSQDYYDKQYRDLFRKPEFRQALSLAFDRVTAKKAIYFQTGDLTTGTMSPKAAEWLVNDEGKKTFASWRDSYDSVRRRESQVDARRARAQGHEQRRLPGVPRRHEAAVAHRQAGGCVRRAHRQGQPVGVGLEEHRDPVEDQPGVAGVVRRQLEVRQVHGPLRLGGRRRPELSGLPAVDAAMEYSRWAPLQGEMYNSIGTKAYTSEADVDPWKRHPPRVMPDAGGPVAKLWKIYNETKIEPDVMKRDALVWEMTKIHVSDGPFFQGTVTNYPQIVVKKTDLNNVPTKDDLALGGFVNPWTHPTPAVYDIESFYWGNPDQHTT